MYIVMYIEMYISNVRYTVHYKVRCDLHYTYINIVSGVSVGEVSLLYFT